MPDPADDCDAENEDEATPLAAQKKRESDPKNVARKMRKNSGTDFIRRRAASRHPKNMGNIHRTGTNRSVVHGKADVVSLGLRDSALRQRRLLAQRDIDTRVALLAEMRVAGYLNGAAQ